MIRFRCVRPLIAAAAFSVWTQSACLGQAARPKPVQKNETKGQAQLAGAYGQFGTVYSLKGGMNFAIVGGRYSVEPYDAYAYLVPDSSQKLAIIEIAIKNADKADLHFDGDKFLTLVDEKGELYAEGSLMLKSKANSAGNFTLKPGQGLGQVELKDPLLIAFVVPAKARIVKVMVNRGRLGKQEDVLRFNIAGATKAEAGEAGDPKNVIAPLPENVRDTADKSGAAALDEGKGALSTLLPSGHFHFKVDGLAFTESPIVDGAAPEEGKRYAVATVTAKLATHRESQLFEFVGGEDAVFELYDSDGEKYPHVAVLKAKADEAAEREFKFGEELTFRVVFTVPKEGGLKKLVAGANNSRKWAFDVSSIK